MYAEAKERRQDSQSSSALFRRARVWEVALALVLVVCGISALDHVLDDRADWIADAENVKAQLNDTYVEEIDYRRDYTRGGTNSPSGRVEIIVVAGVIRDDCAVILPRHRSALVCSLEPKPTLDPARNR